MFLWRDNLKSNLTLTSCEVTMWYQIYIKLIFLVVLSYTPNDSFYMCYIKLGKNDWAYYHFFLETVEFKLPFDFPAHGIFNLPKCFSMCGLVKYYIWALYFVFSKLECFFKKNHWRNKSSLLQAVINIPRLQLLDWVGGQASKFSHIKLVYPYSIKSFRCWFC